LIDDLVTKGTNEPYRMFTSRAEYRLLLREDNADFRLREKGYRLGIVPEETYRRFCSKRKRVEDLTARLSATYLKPDPGVLDRLKELGSAPIRNRISLAHLLKRSDILFEHLRLFDSGLDNIEEPIAAEVETRIKYQGYIDRQERQVAKLRGMEEIRLPETLDYNEIYGLSTEVKEKLGQVRPISLGQASRISGITPAALMAVQVHLKQKAPDNSTL
jgi:tRNA uridine 5-carboxymethylaminomethyl modification enzyme